MPTNKPLTRRDLDAAACSTPGCDHTAHDGLILNGRCHPRGTTLSEYRDGIVTITCAECGRVVTQIAVQGA